MANTVQEYSQDAAEAFIQTAVFVDDRLYGNATTSVSAEQKKVVAPAPRKRATKSAAKEPVKNLINIDDDSDSTPDALDIVNSFAKKQIVCSLYQPRKDASVSPKSELFPLCKAADVVIVDWDLYGDKGNRALELIDGLISQALNDVPEQLRLILVYTHEPNLFSIGSDVFDRVSKNLDEGFSPTKADGGLSFHTRNSRVVVLGKPGRKRVDVDDRFVVDEGDLAEVTIREFAKLASGLLHAASLSGLAKIRQNSRKILSKFNADLDPGFMSHLAMSRPIEDASRHVIPLLVSEIEAVLEDALPDPLISESVLNDWIDNSWEQGTHLSDLIDSSKDDPREVGKVLVSKGYKEASQKFESLSNLAGDSKARKAGRYFLSSEKSMSNHRFSHLMASRTFYGDKKKVLQLGSVVHERNKDRYLLCVQPLCDSVRLPEQRTFVFIEMRKSNGTDGEKTSHLIPLESHRYQELYFETKSYNCVTREFKPKRGSGEIAASAESDNAIFFEDVAGSKYYWVDQMRPAHAQRAVESFASDLSRVGLTESEWLRRLNRS